MSSPAVGPDTATDVPYPEEESVNPFPPYLSPSQVNGLLTCGEQFRLTRLVKVPERPMWASIGGSTVHLITERLDREAYEKGEA